MGIKGFRDLSTKGFRKLGDGVLRDLEFKRYSMELGIFGLRDLGIKGFRDFWI